MNVIKKIISFIFNPFNTMLGEKATNKITEGFAKHTILTFFVSLLITGIIFAIYYFIL